MAHRLWVGFMNHKLSVLLLWGYFVLTYKYTNKIYIHKMFSRAPSHFTCNFLHFCQKSQGQVLDIWKEKGTSETHSVAPKQPHILCSWKQNTQYLLIRNCLNMHCFSSHRMFLRICFLFHQCSFFFFSQNVTWYAEVCVCLCKGEEKQTEKCPTS